MIGERIRKRRLELGLTQEELAKRMGYKHKSSINKIELNVNDVNQTKLQKFAKALECDPNDLLDNVPHNDINDDEMYEIAKRFFNMPNDMRENVLQYICFLESQLKNKEDAE